uniref:Glycosyltransferase n=1 Tax=Rhizophora mucronata TaxID=61149 RepID=A0A2P2IQG1_RHIMU
MQCNGRVVLVCQLIICPLNTHQPHILKQTFQMTRGGPALLHTLSC